MAIFNSKQIQSLDKIFKINLINSCSGFKSANLLGSISNEGIPNVAVFSSVTHLGSSPPTLGFILRPTTVPRNTYKNIKESGVFTINHIYEDIIEDAHHTSAKYPDEVSEFTKTGLEEEFLGNFPAPFVKGAKIRLGCKFLNQYEIKENDTLLLVSAIEHVFIADEEIQQEDGWLKLENANTVTINGLDGYATTSLIERYAYARPKKS